MVDINRKTFRDIDWLLLLTPVALTALGCVGIHSTAPHAEMTKQLIALGIGLVAAIILIALEHDTGTMLTFGTILGAFFFLSGLRKVLVAAGLVAVVIGLIAVYPHLRGYQKERIDVILHPEKADPKGYAYQTIQSV